MRSNIQDEGDEDYAASTTGFVEGIRSEPALSHYFRGSITILESLIES